MRWGTEAQQYDLTSFIGGVRRRVDRWRELPGAGVLAGDAGPGGSPAALAQRRVRRHPAFFWRVEVLGFHSHGALISMLFLLLRRHRTGAAPTHSCLRRTTPAAR